MREHDPYQAPARPSSDDGRSPEQAPARPSSDDGRSPDQALARILFKQGGSPVGAGFLISRCQVITCAHVVNEALGRSKYSSPKPKARVKLNFPLAESNKPLKASVQQWYPASKHPCKGLNGDIAVLEIERAELPEGARPVSFSKIIERAMTNRKVSMFGFPEGHDNGLWSTGTIRGETGDGWYQIDNDPGYDVIIKGFSGSPVLDKQDYAVGMIVGGEDQDGKTRFFFIPGSTILRACPEIDRLCACPEIDRQVTGKPALGKLIPRMCDRDSQDWAFWDFFCRRYENFPHQPQFYICYGEQGEAHRSLIDRLIDHRIKSCFGKRWTKPIMPSPVFRSWNLKGSSIKEILPSDLFEKFEPGYMDGDYSIKALCSLPVFKKYQVVTIVHDILVSTWKKKYGDLIEWYLKDYWGGTEWPDDVSQFLIFLNIQYTGSREAGAIRAMKRIFGLDRLSLRGIEKALTRVRESVGESCLLFDALESVEINDVRRWFLDNNMINDEFGEADMMEKINKLFEGKQRLSMAKVERELTRIHKEYQKKEYQKNMSELPEQNEE